MSEFKVLGASERNLKAINMALSLGGSRTVAGIATPDLKFKENNDKVQPFVHPFKMSIVTEEGTPYLDINEGRISICTDTQMRTYVSFFDEAKLDLSELSTDSDYFVILVIKYDWTGEGDDFDNTFYQCNVYFSTAPITTNYIPAVRGFQTTIIGKINRDTTEDDKVVWSIVRQDLTSDLFLDFHAMMHPFSLTANSNAFTDGSLKNDYNLSDFSFHVQSGNVIVGEEIINVPESTFSASGSKTFVYCSINEDTLSASINPQQSQLQFHDTQNKTYNHLVGLIEFNAQQFGIAIDQYIYQEIGTGADTYKVKTISGDAQPDYLSAKFIFDEGKEEYPESGYTNTLIGGQCVSSAVTQQGLSGTQYKVKPIWMWMNIDDYDKNKEQYLTNSKGSLKWAAGGLEVSGSLKNWEEITEVSGNRILRWKPEYKPSGFAEKFYFMASYRNDDQQVTNRSVLSGLSFGKSALEEEKDAVMIWSRENGEPYVTIPPPSSNISKEWCLVGEKTSGVVWKPYKSANISLTGSIKNLFEIVDSASGNLLRVKTEYDESIDQFHFVNLEDDGTLSATSFFGDPDADGIASIMCWNYEALEPQVFFCQDESEDDDYILAGSKESGLYWVGLYAAISSEIMELSSYLSGEIYKVKVTGQDPSAMFLSDKIYSDLSSLIITVEEDVSVGDEYLNIEINPDYFYSEDDSIYIEETEDGLNFMVSSYLVQCSETDDYPDFLSYKLTSENGSLTGYVIDDSGYEMVNIEINPDYFFSSDGSIFIEESEDGLDFTISSYMVQVQDGDLPEFLADKITSENGSLSAAIGENGEGMTVDLSINPDYFFSSDGSIYIEATEDGLDFTISSAIVSVSEDDEYPDYLGYKIDSENGSLSAEIVSNNGYEVFNLQINPGYFYSSDGTIGIEETQNGLDFTISSAVVSVFDGDLPQFLEDKITSENESLIVDQSSNGEGATVDLSINPEYFISSDESLDIEETEDGLDFTGAGRVQVTGEDDPGYLEDKLVVDSSIASLIALEEDGGVLYITSALSGSGLLKVDNGQISFLTPPGSGKYLLACDNGTFSWVEYADCEDACSGSQQ